MERTTSSAKVGWRIGWVCVLLVFAQSTAGADLGIPEDEEEVQGLRERLTEREDELRTETPLVVDFMGRPLVLNAQYELVMDYIDRIPLGGDQRTYGQNLLSQELEGEAFYSINTSFSLFVQLRLIMENDLLSQTPDEVSDLYVERGEMWIHVAEIAGLPVSLEVGRLNFEDDRRWWWDEDLDAVRLIYEVEDLELAVAAAQELASTRSDQNYVEPEFEDVFRLITEASWDWAENHTLQFFSLYHNDSSNTEQPGAIIRSDREDESDAELIWLGLRAAGAFDLESRGLLGYWLDVAQVAGTEKLLETEETDPATPYVGVEDVIHQDVSGWGFDSGLTWVLPLFAQPRFTLGYAVGSGDSRPDSGTERAFRQTDIHANENGYGGVESFRAYGELLDPELSNITIFTAGAGVSLMEASSLDLIYHNYRLMEYADSLRSSRLEDELTGASRDLGQGFDLILALEEWDAVQFRITGSLFQAGDAFGSDKGEWISGGLFEFRLAF